MEPSDIEKVVELDAHIGCDMNGLTVDAKALTDKAEWRHKTMNSPTSRQ